MGELRVLVAYGTKYGSTAEIADWIAEALRERDVEAYALAAADVADVRRYAAVVLGAGLYAGRWQRNAVHFARRYRGQLQQRPVWLFSSGPLDTSASERDIPAAPGVARIATRLDAREHRTFGGCLSENATGFIARKLVKSGRGGDFRDREQIREWAHAIAAELSGVNEGR